MSNNWTRISDDKISHIWKCPNCGDFVRIGPSFYADGGTPICVQLIDINSERERECDTDMEYCYTEINLG